MVAVAVAITHAHAQQKSQVSRRINIHASIMTMIFQDYWWLGLPSPFGGRNYNLEEVCKMFDRFSVVYVVFQIHIISQPVSKHCIKTDKGSQGSCSAVYD